VSNTEAKLISAVLKDKQIHVLLQANVDTLLRTHNDIWNFIRLYSEQNNSLPPSSLVVEKFRDFSPVADVGATKHHLNELQQEYLNDSLKDILRNAAGEVQAGQGTRALEDLIQRTSELKKNTAAIRDIDVTDIESAVAYYEQLKKQQELGHIGQLFASRHYARAAGGYVGLSRYWKVLAIAIFCGTGMEARKVTTSYITRNE
jgi:hypothetical protein